MGFQEVKRVAEEYQKNSKAPLAFGFKDLQTGESIYYHGDEPFPTASQYKMFILAELFRKAYTGECSLSDRYCLTDSIKSGGSGVLDLMKEGLNLTLNDWATLMMILSDNTATNFLFEFTGRDNIKKNVIDALGLKNTKCDWNCSDLLDITYECRDIGFKAMYAKPVSERPSYHMSKYYACTTEENDQSSPMDSAKLLELLYTGKWVCPEASKGMLDIMKECQTNSRIPKFLPDGVEVAHKTGSLDRLNVDCGIVFTPDHGDYILCLYYNGNLSSKEDYDNNPHGSVGDEYLAELSRDIYKAFIK